MNYHINQLNNKPAYLQLYEYLKKDIVTGAFPYGSKMPSKRTLAEETGVSVITVQHAYEILCDEGYLEGRQRSGYFAIYKDSDFFSVADSSSARADKEAGRIQTRQGTEHETGLAVNHHKAAGHAAKAKKAFPFSVLSKTMRKVLLDYGDSILVKSPNHGCRELRVALSAYLARSNGITARPEQIIIGSGAEYLYSLMVQLLGKERIFALEHPSYEKIRRVYQANGVTCDLLKLEHDGIRTSELERTEATVLHITPFNSFPSGITASVSKRQEYLNWAKRRGAYIIEDNYDSELTVSMKNDDTVFSMAKNSSVIYLNTFSETVAPSMRVGYLVLPEALLPTFEEKLGFYSCTVPVFEQYVLAELINNGDFERHINRVRRERRKTVKENT
ncbi:MAG: PLP-dependent aminotransferase family protein [Lachnospiraceae bacterium]|nr:PLP-dependent aminotransferase family protein [Lachnospiraceae bacterium]